MNSMIRKSESIPSLLSNFLRPGSLLDRDFFDIASDMIFKAIGQSYIDATHDAVKLEAGRIAVDSEKRTSVSGIWAGGDCAAGCKDLTVAAVDDGRRAAESIHAFLVG